MSTEAWLLLLVWNSAYGRSCAETTHFLHLVQVNLPEIHYFSLFISLFITLTYVLIPNILAKTSSPFFFIRVIVCCKCQDNAQCSVISNCVYKLFSSKENRVTKKWRYIFWSIRWCHVRFHILYQIQKQLLTGIL